MRRKCLLIVLSVGVCSVLLSNTLFARAAIDRMDKKDPPQGKALQQPCFGVAMHRVGKLVLAINNDGSFATGFTEGAEVDYFTGQSIPAGGGEYPKGSGHQYVFAGSFWIGAVIGRDTLVSTGADGWIGVEEMFPEPAPFGCLRKRSIIDPSKEELYEDAVSEEDYIAVYMDTFIQLAGTDDEDGGRQHRPLGIEVTQTSYAWSYSYAEDLVLFDYKIRNIGQRLLENVYMGVYVDADVCADCGTTGFDDDICGFREKEILSFAQCEICEYEDDVFIAWIADADGDLGELDPNTGQPAEVPHVTATRIVRTPSQELDVSFNWWISNGTASLDFGPRERGGVGRLAEPFRDFRTGGLGTPARDDNKYYVLRNREFDYDQIYTASIQPNDSLWLYPNQTLAANFADGYDTRYLLSFGPFDISPGQTLPISFAYVGGEDLHTDETNAANLPGNPEQYYDGLDFSDLSDNARWASWIYDNPGVDTDGDGYAGDSIDFPLDSVIIDSTIDSIHVDPPNPPDTFWAFNYDYTVVRTFWVRGDGTPDFRGASPPPAPVVWVTPEEGRLHVRFNGLRSETTEDVFSREADFEGYRVYLARDERSASYSVISSYDIEDYNKFVFNSGRNVWELLETPFTLEELRRIYNDPNLDPLRYTRNSPFHPFGFPDSSFYFEAQDFNMSELNLPGGIRKRFPDQPYPSALSPDSAKPGELTEDGYFKYFEYEFTIDDLLPSVPYWVNVTAFDYGSPASGLGSLETSVTVGAVEAFPQNPVDKVKRDNLEVVVYPNPYRIDAGYKALGFEGRRIEQISENRPEDRVREIHFTNLPAKCTIRIYTLDGDLVREIEHDRDPSDPTAMHESWDLITRNTQLVVSGLYYWTVESPDRETQVGKLVIIM